MKTLSIKNEFGELRKIPQFTDDIFDSCALDGKLRLRLRVALDEALTNCVCYAYDTPGEGGIEVSASAADSRLTFTIKDSGREFNPLEYKADDPDALKVGGLGISIIKSTFDKVEYERTGEQNILKLIKQL